MTDGKGVSIQCVLPKEVIKDTSKIVISDDKVYRMTTSPKGDHEKKYTLIDPEDANLPKMEDIVSGKVSICQIDPGIKAPITVTIYRGKDERMESFKFTNKQYYDQCGMTNRNEVIKKLSSKNEDVKSFNTMTLSRKTADVLVLSTYLRNLFKHIHELMKFKNKKEIKFLKFSVYRKKQKVREKIRKLIPDNSVIALGNARINPTFGHLPCVPTRSLNKFIYAGKRVFEVCEFRTSQVCSKCVTYLEDPIVPRKNGDKQEINSYSTRRSHRRCEDFVRCPNNECSCMLWDRDVNASINIGNKLLNVINNRKSHQRFSRSWPTHKEEIRQRSLNENSKKNIILASMERSAKDASV